MNYVDLTMDRVVSYLNLSAMKPTLNTNNWRCDDTMSFEHRFCLRIVLTK